MICVYVFGVTNCRCQWRFLWRLTVLPSVGGQVNLQLLLEDTRVQQEWAAQLLACRGPAFAQLFTVLINKLRPSGGCPGDAGGREKVAGFPHRFN